MPRPRTPCRSQSKTSCITCLRTRSARTNLCANNHQRRSLPQPCQTLSSTSRSSDAQSKATRCTSLTTVFSFRSWNETPASGNTWGSSWVQTKARLRSTFSSARRPYLATRTSSLMSRYLYKMLQIRALWPRLSHQRAWPTSCKKRLPSSWSPNATLSTQSARSSKHSKMKIAARKSCKPFRYSHCQYRYSKFQKGLKVS